MTKLSANKIAGIAISVAQHMDADTDHGEIVAMVVERGYDKEVGDLVAAELGRAKVTWTDIDNTSLDDKRIADLDDNDAQRHAGKPPLNKRGNPAAEYDIGNKLEIAEGDLRQIVRKLRNVARNIPAAKVCNELANDICDVLNFLNDEGQTP